MNVIEFKDTQGRPVIISTQNYFAATLLEEREEDGSRVWQIVSTGGFGVDVVVPKGQDLTTWLRAE